MRAWLSLAAALVCVVLSLIVGGAIGLGLVLLAIGFAFDGGTRWFQRAGGTGGLTSGRQ
jgi:hypothetical protein